MARMLAHCGGHAEVDDPSFSWISRDVLNPDTAKVTRDGQSLMPQILDEVIRKVCGSPKRRRNGGGQTAKEQV
jgi:hypothetical protein